MSANFRILPTGKQTPAIHFQQSIKIRIACCNIDFNIYDGVAIEDEFLRKRLNAVDKILEEQHKNPPHLIIFPEFAACNLLLDKAKIWSEKYNSIIVCGSYLNTHESCMKGVIIEPGTKFEFYKKELSPYDPGLASSFVTNGLTPGCDLDLTTNQGTVSVKVLICYDFYKQSAQIKWEDTQLVVCPMYDPTWFKAQEKAHDLATLSVRTLLVNKPRVSINLDKSRSSRTLWLWSAKLSRTCFVHILRLPKLKQFYDKIVLSSSANGPLNGSDHEHLSNLGGIKRGKRHTSIWETNVEGIIIGNYELGLESTTGNQNRFGSGYNYEAFNTFKIKEYL